MRAIWNGILSTARFDHPALPWPVAMVVHPRARRLRLRIDTERGEIRLTCPPRASRRAALDWAVTQRAWIDRQIAARPAADPFAPGSFVPLDGIDHRLDWQDGASRRVVREHGTLRVGGPRESLPARIERWLREEARAVLSAETRRAAERAGVTVSAVSVGDAGTRWGSCSASGAIRFNWRLVMAPPYVRQWVVAHEVAHRLHMDHSPDFHAAEARIYDGDCAAARRELRALGPRLKGIGRGR